MTGKAKPIDLAEWFDMMAVGGPRFSTGKRVPSEYFTKRKKPITVDAEYVEIVSDTKGR